MAETDADNESPSWPLRPWPLAGDIQFWAMRGMAIKEYTSLEHALFELFHHLGNIDPQTAGTIFYRITSAAGRNAILEKMFRGRFANEYNLFRNSFIKQLRSIDNERNEIVHWSAIVRFGRGWLYYIDVP